MEFSLLLGLLSLGIGGVIKLLDITAMNLPKVLGLGPKEFLGFSLVCFLFALCVACRKGLIYLEEIVRRLPSA
jgi:hypothetical protein